jgi:hypothetical protein
MTERCRLPNQQQSASAMTVAEMIERAATTSIAPFVSLDEAAADINAEFRRVVDAHEKLTAARTSCATGAATKCSKDCPPQDRKQSMPGCSHTRSPDTTDRDGHITPSKKSSARSRDRKIGASSRTRSLTF